jgi:hypothetical protein
MTQDSNESILRRWSRRKQEAAQETRAAEQAAPIDIEDSLGTAVPIETEAESSPALTDADMPPIESLDEDSDYSAFMSEGVSDELRNLALRKLYFEKLGDIVTCDMKHHIEMKEQKEREALAREAEEIADEDLDSMESIEEEVDADLEAIEKFEDKDMLEERTEILADAELDPEFKQESKND